MPGGQNSGACRVADDCGLKNFSTFGCKIGNNLGDQKKTTPVTEGNHPAWKYNRKRAPKRLGDLVSGDWHGTWWVQPWPVISTNFLTSRPREKLPCRATREKDPGICLLKI